MVTGRVRIIKIGFTKKFKRLNTIATIIAVVYESTPIPGNILDNITTANALNKTRKIIFIL